jgi:hypothetical protein
LPGRREGLHRSRLLRRSARAASAHRATSRRPTSSRTSSATTCRSWRESIRRCARHSAAIPSRQRAVGAPRAASRLLGRRVGPCAAQRGELEAGDSRKV